MTTYKVEGYKWDEFEYYEEFETDTYFEALGIAEQLEEEGFHQIDILEDDEVIFSMEDKY